METFMRYVIMVAMIIFMAYMSWPLLTGSWMHL